MRVTTFTERDGTVQSDTEKTPAWQPFEEYDGNPLDGVRLVELGQTPQAEFQLVHIAIRRTGGD